MAQLQRKKQESKQELLTISTDEKFAGSLKYILRRLSEFVKNGGISAELCEKPGRLDLAVAVNYSKDLNSADMDENRISTEKLLDLITDCIADVVITDYKFHYIESSIKLPIEDEISRHAFIKALSNFDSDTDKEIAKSLIKLTPVFLLDSFYQFMIDDLRARWNEVCVLANENASYLVCTGTFRELLRFLISNLESREREIHLFESKGGIEVLTSCLKPVSNIYVNEDLAPDVKVISKLISIAPKKIYLHQNADNQKLPIFDFIQTLFSGCVQIMRT